MSIFWCLGQFVVNLVIMLFRFFGFCYLGLTLSFLQLAWPLIANFSCPIEFTNCQRSENMGWRYLLFMLGGITLIMWCLRFFFFDLVESPRYLIGKGKDEEAVAVIHKIAAYNSTTSSLTVEHLKRIGSMNDRNVGTGDKGILSKTSNFTAEHIKALFATKTMAYSTSLLISIWGMSTSIHVLLLSVAETTLGIIGLASTLYNNFLPFLCVIASAASLRGAHR